MADVPLQKGEEAAVRGQRTKLMTKRGMNHCMIGVVWTLAQPAVAQEAASTSMPPVDPPPAAAPVARTPRAQSSTPQSGLSWDPRWRRVGLAEYIVGGGFGAGAATLYLVEQPQTPSWREPVLFDEWARERLRLSSRRARSNAQTWSDVVDGVSSVHLFVIDSWIVPAAIHRRPEVAWQLFGMNLQSYGLSMFVNRLVKRFTRRARPFVEPCEQDPEIDDSCGSREANVSFYSGHSTSTATSAGLICAHHTHLDLYGGGVADAAACAVSVSFALLAGGLRIASDNHWATDVAVGHLTGVLSGYVLPSLLYYRGFGSAKGGESTTTSATPFIWPDEHGVRLGMFGYF